MRATRTTAPLVLALAIAPAPSEHAALSPADYRVGRLCAAPLPGHAGCLGLRLLARRPYTLRGSRRVPKAVATPAAPAPAVKREEFVEPPAGAFSPQSLLGAYALGGAPTPARQQTLALVDAYDDPTAEHDLGVFDERYGLPACTAANGCFTKVKVGSPATEPGWAQEIATDVETAHGICQSCKILPPKRPPSARPRRSASRAPATTGRPASARPAASSPSAPPAKPPA